MKKILYVVIAIILLMLVLYFSVFHDGFSNDSGNWGDFGSYIGGIGSLALPIAVFYYSYQADKRDKKIELLKQIEIVLTKIEEHKNSESDVGIRTSFAVCMSLAKAFGVPNLPKEEDWICIEDMKMYANKWLNYIENKTL